MIYLLTNEYVTSYIESSSDIHYYFFDVNSENKYPDPGE